MVACSEQVEQQTMQDGEHQGGSGLPATGVRFMRFITAGGLKAFMADGCVPALAASPGPMIEVGSGGLFWPRQAAAVRGRCRGELPGGRSPVRLR
jgi:hypothetical protein